HVAAAVDVDAVAVGVDGDVVDGEVVDAGEEEAEVSAFEDREITEEDVAAVFERDGFVAYARLFGQKTWGASDGTASGSATEALAPDEAGAGDGDVVDALAPDERVVPVVVAVVLVGRPRVVG